MKKAASNQSIRRSVRNLNSPDTDQSGSPPERQIAGADAVRAAVSRLVPAAGPPAPPAQPLVPTVPPPAGARQQSPVRVAPQNPLVLQQPRPRAYALRTMAYIADVNLQRAQRHSFVRSENLVPVLETISRLRFSIKVARDNAIRQLDDALSEVYDFSERAPEVGSLINVTVSVAADFIRRVVSALDVGEREGEQTNNIDDKKLSAIKASDELLRLILTVPPAQAATYGIFDRVNFERKYRLQIAAAAR